MCGLAFSLGELSLELKNSKARRTSIINELKARGPDSTNELFSDLAYLLHTRLMIVGSETATQPLQDKEKTVSILFNGEIYNHKELRRANESAGAKFLTDTDGEVILHGYKQLGLKVINKLDGMFAGVIYDHKKRKAILFRDRLGIKPLYYALHKNSIFAGSTEKAVSIGIDQAWGDLNLAGLDQYLAYGFNFFETTLLNDIKQLQPGHCLEFDEETRKVRLIAYWQAQDAMNVASKPISAKDGVNMLTRSINAQSDTNLSLACMLSSGLDSNIISHLLRKEKCTSHYTASFDDPVYDEWNEVLSLQLPDHTRVAMGSEDLLNVNTIKKAFSTPFGDNAAIPTMLVSQEIAKRHRIAYSGDGADELFFGYRNHRMLSIESKLLRFTPNSLKPLIIKAVHNLPTEGFAAKLVKGRSTLHTFCRSWGESYLEALSLIERKTLNSLYTEQFKTLGAETLSSTTNLLKETPHLSPMKQIQLLDLNIYLPGDILKKTDRASMAFGVEARVPYLSNEIVDYALSSNERCNLSAQKGKLELRRWAKESGLNHNPKKKAFVNPIQTWLKKEPPLCVKRAVLSNILVKRGIFCSKSLNIFIEREIEEGFPHAVFVWNLIMLNAYFTE